MDLRSARDDCPTIQAAINAARACVFLNWSKMVLILFLAFGSLLGAWIPNGNQEQVRAPKGEQKPFKTNFGTGMHSRKWASKTSSSHAQAE
jgi:hypothetical protein